MKPSDIPAQGKTVNTASNQSPAAQERPVDPQRPENPSTDPQAPTEPPVTPEPVVLELNTWESLPEADQPIPYQSDDQWGPRIGTTPP